MPCAYSATSSSVLNWSGRRRRRPTRRWTTSSDSGARVERHARRAAAPCRGSCPVAEIAAAAAGRARVVAVTDAEAVGVGGHDLDVERRDAELGPDELRVVGLAAVGLGGQAQHHLARRVHAQEDGSVGLVSHWIAPFSSFESLPLLVGGQRVVLLQVAERGLRAAERMRRDRGPLAAGVDAGLTRAKVTNPASCCPRLGP